MPGTQHHQLSLEMGRFNGRVYVPYSSEESKSASEESSDEQHSGRDSQRPALKKVKPRSYRKGPQSSEESADEQYGDRGARLSAPNKVNSLTPRTTNSAVRAKLQSTPKRVKPVTPRSSTSSALRATPQSRSAGKENSTGTANQDHLPRARKHSLPLLP